MKKCRLCEISKKIDNRYDGLYCREMSVDFTCLLCNSKNNILYHAKDDCVSGYSYECNVCHNYIKYFSDNMDHSKDEFCMPNFDVINDFEDKHTYILDNSGAETIKLPFIKFIDEEHFINRVKSLIIFS